MCSNNYCKDRHKHFINRKDESKIVSLNFFINKIKNNFTHCNDF